MKFINDLLSPEIHTLRFWGIENEDYMVGEGGVFYRTAEQRGKQSDESYVKKHFCNYGAFPFYLGMDQDGINAYSPDNQPGEYFSTLVSPLVKCYDAYGVNTPAELINAVEENALWYPMWSYTNRFTDDTDYGRAKIQMDDVKHRHLPKVVMSSDFEAAWEEYMREYKKCDTRSYFNELTSEIRRRSGS
jgi:putative aldouronate transport system substrate-binding protein